MLFSKSDLLSALKNQIIQCKIDEAKIDKIVIDSRQATENSLFICIKGENNDGHDFINQALKNGCKAILIDNEKLFSDYDNLILVKNSFDSLYDLARFSREKSKAKIIAVTGSMGKTTTKEIIKTVFQSQGKTYATHGNLNNHFGLPLTLANMEKETEFAVLEMGMNHLNEISPLSKLAKPDIAIITGITSAHIENFDNEEGIALAKSEIFHGLSENGFAIINGDTRHFEFLQQQANKKTKNIISFGFNKNNDYQLESFKIINQNLSKINIKSPNQKFDYEISSSNKAILINSLMAVICLKLISTNFEKGLEKFKDIQASQGRGNVLEIHQDNKKITIIDDSYNANLASVKAGIDYLVNLKDNLKKQRSILVLGDILELGAKSPEIHKEALDYAISKNIDLIFTIGNETKKSLKSFDKFYQNYENSEIASKKIKNIVNDGDIILVKGSRGINTEKIIEEIKK